jgi:2'-5' RNA ligase
MAFFIAVVPDHLKDNNELKRVVSKCKRTLDDKDKEVRWVPSDLWHVTVQYLGDLTPDMQNSVIDFLETWQPPATFKNIELRLQGMGCFPSVEKARVLWVGVQKNQALVDAQADLVTLLNKLPGNILADTEDREYHPHLTLARFRNLFNASSVAQLGGRKHFGDYPVHELLLLESVVQGHMTKYIPVLRKPL